MPNLRLLAGAAMFAALGSVPAIGATVNIGQIMPLGDSITYGYDVDIAGTQNYAGGYRTEFYNDLTAAGIGFNFVGSLNTNPSTTLTTYDETAHEGHSGYTIGRYLGDDGTPHPDGGLFANLTANTQYEVSHANNGAEASFVTGTPYINATVQPQSMLILAGINNIVNNYSEGETINSMQQMLTVLTATLPNSHLYVSTLIPCTESTANLEKNVAGLTTQIVQSEVSEFNTDLATLVTSYDKVGYNVTLVDSYDKFMLNGSVNTNLLSSDGIHPSAAGYTVLGDAFADAVIDATPEPTSATLLAIGCATLFARRRPRRPA